MQLGTRFQQLVQRADLLGDRSRRKVIHVFEGNIDRHIALTGQSVRYGKRDAGLDCLHPRIEIVEVDFRELAIGDIGKRLFRLAGEVCHHAHHERNLHLLLGAIHLDVVLNLYARRPVLRNPLLTTLFS